MNNSLLPDQRNKIAVVTGGNIGLGFESSLQLTRAGAQVVIACRDTDKGERARRRILHEVPQAQLEVLPLDLTRIDAIDQFCQAFSARHDRLDLLLNNAGVVNLENLRHTESGREMHMATNHLGHFALTGRLMPQLLASPQARVVTVSSGGYKWGVIDFDDLDWHHRPYHRVKSYGDSKLANLLFMEALQRRFEALGSSAVSLAAHPGLTATERQQSIGVGGRLSRCLATPVNKGVRPQLVAATSPKARGGDFWGPAFGLWGAPKRHTLKPEILDQRVSQRLWSLSEQLTGVHFPAGK